jgi:hypothetical protein
LNRDFRAAHGSLGTDVGTNPAIRHGHERERNCGTRFPSVASVRRSCRDLHCFAHPAGDWRRPGLDLADDVFSFPLGIRRQCAVPVDTEPDAQ